MEWVRRMIVDFPESNSIQCMYICIGISTYIELIYDFSYDSPDDSLDDYVIDNEFLNSIGVNFQ